MSFDLRGNGDGARDLLVVDPNQNGGSQGCLEKDYVILHFDDFHH